MGEKDLTRRQFLYVTGTLIGAVAVGSLPKLLLKLLEDDLPPPSNPSIDLTDQSIEKSTVGQKELENGRSIVINVPLQSQQDKRWSNINLGRNPKKAGFTIGSYGCLITSLSSYLMAAGEGTMTPDHVNNKLIKNGGYQGKSGNFDVVKGPQALGLTEIDHSKNYSDKPVDQKGLRFVQQNLSAGRPLLAKVDMDIETLANEEHYVLIVGYGKDKNGQFIYTYMDSWDGALYSVEEKFFARKAIQFFAYDKSLMTNVVETKDLPLQSAGQTEIEMEPVSSVASGLGINYDTSLQLNGSYPKKVARWTPQIIYFTNQKKIPAELVAAVIEKESAGNPKAYSKSGAVGLMQVMPKDGIAASFGCFSDRPTIAQLKDPEFNIKYGTAMLTRLIRKNKGNVREALKAYGPINYGYKYADQVLETWRQNSPESYSQYFNK